MGGKREERGSDPLHSGFPMLHGVDRRSIAPLIKRHICQPALLIMAACAHWLIFMESNFTDRVIGSGGCWETRTGGGERVGDERSGECGERQ